MDSGSASQRPIRRSWRRGKIIFNQRASVFDCTVRSLAPDGAELVMKSTLGVPSMFELRIEPSGEAFLANVVARTETEIAVAFEARIGAPPAAAQKAAAQRINRHGQW